jgi:TRAP-type C4-dicarboxylate transport system substrate-binding protein
MKRTTLKRLAGLAVLAAWALAGAAQAQTKLKWAHVYEVGEPYHKQALWAADEIKARTNGKYQIEVFPASTLGKETDINQGLTLGTVDIIYTGMAFAGRTYPPMSIAFAEVYLALQNGTVDAQENPLPTIDAKKFYEVQKYIILTGHITESLVTIVGSGTWSKLSDAEKKIFGDVLWEASTRATKDIVQAENALVSEFEKRGKTVVKVDRGPFIQAVQKSVTSPDAPWPRELYDRVQALK